MKKVCFVASHLLSGSSPLCESMNENPRVEHFRLAEWRPYTNMEAVTHDLLLRKHKNGSSAAVYLDELVKNYDLQTKDVYSWCKFVYVVRPARPTINLLVARKLYKPLAAVRYYCYRLRRLSEMSKRTGGVLLTWDDLVTGRGLPLVESHLGLKRKLDLPDLEQIKGTSDVLVPFGVSEEAEQSYERYLSLMRSKLNYWH